MTKNDLKLLKAMDGSSYRRTYRVVESCAEPDHPLGLYGLGPAVRGAPRYSLYPLEIMEKKKGGKKKKERLKNRKINRRKTN